MGSWGTKQKTPKKPNKTQTETHINLLIKLKGKLTRCDPGTINVKGMQSLRLKIMEKNLGNLSPQSHYSLTAASLVPRCMASQGLD